MLIHRLPDGLAFDGPDDMGRMEHHVFVMGERWLKVTKGAGEHFGLCPQLYKDGWDMTRRDATAQHYLQRLQDVNALFHDDHVLHAVYNDRQGNVRLVTSQPHFMGEPAGTPFLRDAMEGAGFVQLDPPSAYYRPSDHTAVMDLHRENALRDGGDLDVLRVFDAIPTRPAGRLREVLEEQARAKQG